MKNDTKIACLGGDARMAATARRLSVLGARVSVFGGEGSTSACLEEALQGAQAVVLPMPAFDGEGRLYCPMAPFVNPPDAAGLFAMIEGDVPILGGRLSPAALEMAKTCGVRLYDYSEREDFKIRNAVPTAEGAICLVMQQMDHTLSGSRMAILGNGCIGAALAHRLQSLGVQVTVVARKVRDVARIECRGLRAIHLTGKDSLGPLTAGYDAIFNTVPHHLMNPELLLAMPKKTLLVELASAPGGWDRSTALPCRALYAPGIPGKLFPTTAGHIVAQTVDTILKEVDLT